LQGVLALSAFQFVNIKAWILILTASAAAQSVGTEVATTSLYAMFVGIPSLCLSAWAACGRCFVRLVRTPVLRARFDRALAIAMILSAALLPFH
jgi:hypothetical protein